MITYFVFLPLNFLFSLVSGYYLDFPIVQAAMFSDESKRQCASKSGQLADFTYGEGPTGPDNWPTVYKTCGGSSQSPINIDMSDLTTKKGAPLQWSSAYFNTPQSMTLTNDNHTVQLTASFPPDCQPKISGGCLSKPYFFSSLNFHWGTRDSKGSEHTIDEFAYPMEMHVIHDGSTGTTGSTGGGKPTIDRVVLAYFFQITENECNVIDKILNGFLKAIKHPHKSVTLKRPFHLAALVRPFSSEYAIYRGSLTTPPCTEGIKWIVHPYPLDINKKQMEKFRMVCKYAPGLVNNFRPVQPLNDRKVYFFT